MTASNGKGGAGGRGAYIGKEGGRGAGGDAGISGMGKEECVWCTGVVRQSHKDGLGFDRPLLKACHVRPVRGAPGPADKCFNSRLKFRGGGAQQQFC